MRTCFKTAGSPKLNALFRCSADGDMAGRARNAVQSCWALKRACSKALVGASVTAIDRALFLA